MDRKGVKYAGEKGNKSFFTKRKQNIEKVNEKLGFIRGEDDYDDDEMTEVKGGTITSGDEKDTLPPIKGYKVDALLGNVGERVLHKF